MERKIKKSILFSVSLLYFGSCLFAQQSVVSAGGSTSIDGNSIDYSIGQVIYATAIDKGGTVFQGVQVPYNITAITGIAEKGIMLQCIVYPNPTTTKIVLSIKNDDVQNFKYQLFDVNGKLVQAQTITTTETNIAMEQYQAGSYFLQVSNKNSLIKSFTIIKQ
jgi:hypothetical protein